MISRTFGSAVHGVDAFTITIEVNVAMGLDFHMSGLPDSAVKESQHRVESAMKAIGFSMPRNKVVVNMAPADIRKEGSAYDLPIAIAILQASGQIDSRMLDGYVLMGELSLDGQLRPIRGVLPIAIQSRRENFRGFVLPKANAIEAAIVNDLDIIGVDTLREAVDFFRGTRVIEPLRMDTREVFGMQANHYDSDFREVQGQENIKRALEIAAAGGHNVIMIGPPGAGKTMLARRLATILPPLSLNEALETTKIHSVAGKLVKGSSLMTARPFRAPHHTISDIALVGGGGIPQPGEISLSHNGVLFLDELPEFKRTVLEVMRQPMEERRVTISRAKVSIDFPANFMLVASMNPCPCGYYNHPDRECTCGSSVVQRYLSRVSGPLLDRIDLHVEVVPVTFDEMTGRRKNEGSSAIRERVVRARAVQSQRFQGIPGIHCNAMMSSAMVKEKCAISDDGRSILKQAMEKLGLSARAYDRILKVSRTIADLESAENISTAHLSEAINYRSLDRETWAG